MSVGIGSVRSPKVIGVGMRVGIGREIGCPFTSGLGTPPVEESKPLRDSMSFMGRQWLGSLEAVARRDLFTFGAESRQGPECSL